MLSEVLTRGSYQGILPDQTVFVLGSHACDLMVHKGRQKILYFLMMSYVICVILCYLDFVPKFMKQSERIVRRFKNSKCQRPAARAHSNVNLEQQLNAAIERSARCDKKKWKLRMLEDFSSARAKWKGIKLEKSTFKPSFYKLKDIHGQSVPLNKKADALAEYLEKRHWARIEHLPPDKVDKREVMDTKPLINTGSITIEEIHEALSSSKTNKAPGPDGLTIELYKYLDQENWTLLARILNQLWTEESYPDDVAYTEVVSIYKKGNPELPEHYRPISLPNSSYTFLTKISQKRIADATDQFVSNTQFGFRRGKSTSEPLFCVRRLQDLAEAGHQNIMLIFLD